MDFFLEHIEDTEKFGKVLAKTLLDLKKQGKLLRTMYLLGEMGVGKTTLTRAFVGALPGTEQAEVASPSFTLCHEYPTDPEVYHADLYRLPDGVDLPEELQDIGRNAVLLIEWAERLHEEAKEADRLEISLYREETDCSAKKISSGEKNVSENIDNFVSLCDLKRHVKISAHGVLACEFEKALEKNLQNCFFIEFS